MMGYALNTYDGLYRYENNPPELLPWLASGHTASADGLDWEFRCATASNSMTGLR